MFSWDALEAFDPGAYTSLSNLSRSSAASPCTIGVVGRVPLTVGVARVHSLDSCPVVFCVVVDDEELDEDDPVNPCVVLILELDLGYGEDLVCCTGGTLALKLDANSSLTLPLR